MFSVVFLTAFAAPVAPPASYAVVFDGGSTGTRVYVYEYRFEPGAPLPTLRADRGWNKKVKPGLSTFADSPRGVRDGYMTPLLDFARDIVPPAARARATVLLRATAGMRLVPPAAQRQIYDGLFEAVRAHGAFSPARELFGTLSGEDEGVFGWLSVQQLLLQARRIAPSQLGEVGALDLGGGSTQITFATPPGARDAVTASAPLSAAGRAVPVFTRSHLGFGNKQALAALTASEAASCLADGANASWEPAKRWELKTDGPPVRQLHGRGAFARCDAAVQRVLGGLQRGAQPPVGGRPFVAMSLFYYAVHFAVAAGHLRAPVPAPGAGAGETGGAAGAAGAAGTAPSSSSTYSVRELRRAAAALCAEDGAVLERRMRGVDPLTPDEAIRWRCFDLTYAAALLSRGYGFADDAAAVQFLGEIDGSEVEWTRGALLAHLMGAATGRARGAALLEQIGGLAMVALSFALLIVLRRRISASKEKFGGHPPYGRLEDDRGRP